MTFEWDESKRLKTLHIRNLDFMNTVRIFDGRPIQTTISKLAVEERYASTALLDDGKYYTVVWTWREEVRRIISFRRARKNEERAYRQVFVGRNQ